MDRMLEELMGFILGVAIMLIFGLVAGLIYFAIAYAIYRHRLNQYRQQAEAAFDEELRRAGGDFDIDEVIRAVHGVGIDLPDDGYDSVGAWAAGSLFGVEEYEEVA